MDATKPLDSKALTPFCDPKAFSFKTTADLADISTTVGQERAIEAVTFASNIKQHGFNLYVLGPSGVGKHSAIRKIIDANAQTLAVPPDWCYVYNFDEPQKPIAIQLPAGKGIELRQDMDSLIEELSIAIPDIFEGEGFKGKMQKIADEFNVEKDKLFKSLEAESKKQEMAIISTPQGYIVMPTHGDHVLTIDEYEKLPEKVKAEKEKIIQTITVMLSDVIEQVRKLQEERRKKEKKILADLIMTSVGYFIKALTDKYKEYPKILAYLSAVENDLTINPKNFLIAQTNELSEFMEHFKTKEKGKFTQYKVNVLIDNSQMKGAPVIYEDNPTLSNLIGKIEHVSQFGVLITNFTLIRAGVLHKANGGFLILDAQKILQNPFTWNALKRALYSDNITIETLSKLIGDSGTVGLEPEAIPLNIKVILVGERILYYLLCRYDNDFKELFKVAADFNEQMPRTTENIDLYSKLIATLARKSNLLPFDHSAVAKVIDQSSRLVGDAEKLSVHMRSIVDLLSEADFQAKSANLKVVEAQHVQQAIANQIRRSDRIREQFYEGINRGFILIDVANKQVGQVNGLSIVQLDDYMFGHPSKITAIVRFGKGKVLNIEREVELSGPIHSKGVLILAGYLQGKYIKDKPLPLDASLVFEQTYGFVEGDSASLGELCALLSALADIPIELSFAVTGSINQLGQVQAIGGVNEKIEGFFDICAKKGLTKKQAVIIPISNAKNLVLRDDVIQAVKKGDFNIYCVETVDQAIPLLMSRPAEEVHSIIEKRLTLLYEQARDFYKDK